MMSARILAISLCVLMLDLLYWTYPVQAGEKPAPMPIHWINVSPVGFQVVGMKKEIALDAATTVKLFVKDFPHLREGWQKNIPAKVEPAANAATIPEVPQGLWTPATDMTPFATVVKFSEKELIVLVLAHKGNYLYYQVSDCLAQFRLPRDKAIDALFNVAALEKTYGAKHKGLKHGDPAAEVTKKLGAPDARISYAPKHFYKLCYFKDNVIITINQNRIESIEFNVPQSLKDEVKEKGPNLVGF